MRVTRPVSVAFLGVLVSAALLTPPCYALAVGRTVGEANVSSTGEASYSIPIFTPPGIKGLTPEVALVYAHRREEGLAGVGWGVSGLSEIARCAKTWAQDGAPKVIELTTADRFCLDGNQLKLVSGNYGFSGSTYRTEVDTVARITAQGTAGNGPAWFKVEQKNGLIYEYGNTTNSRIESLASGFTTTARAWALSKIRDRELNEIVFSYIEDGPPNGDYRIGSIAYRGNPSQGVSAGYAITFVYETQPAGDVDSQFAAGGLIKDVQRLDRIDVFYTTPAANLVRRYELTYEPSLSSTGRSRLASVQECAGSPLECLTATTFEYQNGTNGLGSQLSTGTAIASGARVLPIDINGDGRTDLVYSSSATSGSGTWRYRLANGSGYASEVNSGITNTNQAQAIAIDYNSDGVEDILVPYSGNTWWAIQGLASGLQPPVNTNAPVASTAGNAIALDINGDGRDDLVWAENVSTGGANVPNPEIWVRYRLAGSGFSATATALLNPVGTTYLLGPVFEGPYPQNRTHHFDVNGDGYRDVAILKNRPIIVEGFPEDRYYIDVILGGGNGVFAGAASGLESRGLPIDINGDGYTDIAYDNGSGSVQCRLSVGKAFGPVIAGPSLANLDFGKALTRDWDGDGYEDLLLPSTATTTWHYMRSSGEGLLAAVDSGLPTASPQAVYAVDANGDGLDDIAYVRSNGVYAHLPHAGGKADLLTKATDGYGNAVTLSYLPITQGAYTKYSNATYPDQDYAGPVYVVQTAVWAASTISFSDDN